MAHVKFEEIYGVCHHENYSLYPRECDINADWCCGGCPDDCELYEPKTRYIEREYKRISAEEHDSTYDYLYGYWDLVAGGKTRVCSYLEIDGHVYCDVRNSEQTR